MTVIVGLKDDKGIYIGSDSRITIGNIMGDLIEPKIFKVGDIIMGISGTYDNDQLIRYSMELPSNTENISPLRYLISVFIPAIKKCLIDGGKDLQNLEDVGMILIYKNRVFEVDASLSIIETTDDFVTIGSGADIARGALYATADIQDSRKRVEMAIEAAIEYDFNCGHPIEIQEIE